MSHRATTPSDLAPPGLAPCSDRRGPRRKALPGAGRAFTLLELLVVVAILTSMTAHNGSTANNPAGQVIAPSQAKVLAAK